MQYEATGDSGNPRFVAKPNKPQGHPWQQTRLRNGFQAYAARTDNATCNCLRPDCNLPHDPPPPPVYEEEPAHVDAATEPVNGDHRNVAAADEAATEPAPNPTQGIASIETRATSAGPNICRLKASATFDARRSNEVAGVHHASIGPGQHHRNSGRRSSNRIATPLQNARSGRTSTVRGNRGRRSRSAVETQIDLDDMKTEAARNSSDSPSPHSHRRRSNKDEPGRTHKRRGAWERHRSVDDSPSCGCVVM